MYEMYCFQATSDLRLAAWPASNKYGGRLFGVRLVEVDVSGAGDALVVLALAPPSASPK